MSAQMSSPCSLNSCLPSLYQYLPHVRTPGGRTPRPLPCVPHLPQGQGQHRKGEVRRQLPPRSPGSPGRVKHLVPARWQALQPGGLIVHRVIIVVLGNDFFLWFWQNSGMEESSKDQRDSQEPGETLKFTWTTCVSVCAPGLTCCGEYHIPNPSV